MRWPLKAVFVTQYFGGNPDIYKKFGMLGHNGLDLRAATGTKVLAPHDGKIFERDTDSDGYGKYLKIQNDKEGSVLAHLNKWLVELGQEVKEGDVVAEANNTGFSTAPHLHWGYYRLPRDRKNGYDGFINPLPFLSGQSGPTSEEMDACMADRKKFWQERDAVAAEFAEYKKQAEQKIADLDRDNKNLKELSEQTQKKHEEFIHLLAEKLGSAHDEPSIYAEVEEAVKAEGQLLDARVALDEKDEEIKRWIARVEELERRVSTVKSEVMPNLTPSSGSGKKKGGAWIWQKLSNLSNWITQVFGKR